VREEAKNPPTSLLNFCRVEKQFQYFFLMLLLLFVSSPRCAVGFSRQSGLKSSILAAING
jgi:hypothetical protein